MTQAQAARASGVSRSWVSKLLRQWAREGDELPSRIKEALLEAGFTNPRTGEHSVRALPRELELNNSRASRYLDQGSKMHIEARQQVADALGFKLSELDSLVAGQEVDTYNPPEAANRLTFRERVLVNDLINLLAERHQDERTVTGNDNPAPMNRPDDKVAQLRPEDRPVTRKSTPRWELDQEAANEGAEGIEMDEIPDDSP